MMTIEELKSTEEKPVIIASKQGVIIFVNHQFEKIFEWKFNEIVGKPITTIIPPNFHDAHHLGFSRFQNTEVSTILNHPLKLNAIKKNGDIFAAEHIIQAEKIDDAWVFAATIEPIEKMT
ncbi:MAG: PAS domain S-box protein [Gammaproteobacteria bacterium]|nr:PAS domain S-box protein [Gammaproteobacteria bacterium]